jgi:hypothetical protein
MDRLSALANEVELGETSVSEFANQLLGQTEALEGIPYAMLKEAQMVQAQIAAAIDGGQEQLVNVHTVGDWLREWVARVPVSSR